jgi:hypothetical protein
MDAGNLPPVDKFRCRWLAMEKVQPVDVASYLNYAATNIRTNNMDSLYVTRVHVPLFLKTPTGQAAMEKMKKSKHNPETGLPIKPLSDWLADKPGVHKLRPTPKAREKFLRAACKMSSETFDFMTEQANSNEELSDKACQVAPLSSPHYPAVPYDEWENKDHEYGNLQLFGTQRYPPPPPTTPRCITEVCLCV